MQMYIYTCVYGTASGVLPQTLNSAGASPLGYQHLRYRLSLLTSLAQLFPLQRRAGVLAHRSGLGELGATAASDWHCH